MISTTRKKAFFPVSLVEVNEVGDGFPTWSTPGRPEVKKNDFPLELGKRDLLAIEGLEGEIRGRKGFPLFFGTMREKEYP